MTPMGYPLWIVPFDSDARLPFVPKLCVGFYFAADDPDAPHYGIDDGTYVLDDGTTIRMSAGCTFLAYDEAKSEAALARHSRQKEDERRAKAEARKDVGPSFQGEALQRFDAG